MAKRVADEEWLPKDAKKKKAKPAAKSTAPPRPEGLAQEQERFLNQHKAYIIKEYEDGETYATIARALVTKAGLRDEAVKPKDISNWIDYRKRTGQIKTRRVNAKNKNIKATDGDWYQSAQKIASASGAPALDDDLSEDEAQFSDNEVEIMRLEMAASLLRYFTVFDEEQNVFALFVESGVERKVECRVVEDDTHIELSVMMPLPPDELLSFAGFKAVAANLSPCNETFLIAAPAKLRKESRSLMHYPNDSLPLWNVFRYQLEELSYDPGLESEFHMQEAFAKLAAKLPRPTEKNDTPRSGAISENNSAPSKQRNANESA